MTPEEKTARATELHKMNKTQLVDTLVSIEEAGGDPLVLVQQELATVREELETLKSAPAADNSAEVDGLKKIVQEQAKQLALEQKTNPVKLGRVGDRAFRVLGSEKLKNGTIMTAEAIANDPKKMQELLDKQSGLLEEVL